MGDRHVSPNGADMRDATLEEQDVTCKLCKAIFRACETHRTLVDMRATPEDDMQVEGATHISIKFGDHARVTWPSHKAWAVWTGLTDPICVGLFATMEEACAWARKYAASYRKPR